MNCVDGIRSDLKLLRSEKSWKNLSPAQFGETVVIAAGDLYFSPQFANKF
jgi:hypothetical protein